MARTPASAGIGGVGKSGSPAPRSMTSSPAALRRFASCEIAIVADVSRCCRLGDKPEAGGMGDRIARAGDRTQPGMPRLKPGLGPTLPSRQRIAEPTLQGGDPRRLPFSSHARTIPRGTRPLTTEDRVTVAEVKLALERGRPVVLVRPPAVEQVADLWELIVPETPGRRSGVGPAVLIICADDASAAEWAGAAPATLRTHAATGLARTIRILTDHPVDVLAGGVDQLGALVHRAALKLGQVSTVLVAWPETLVAGAHAAALDTLLAEARDARRVVLSWNLLALRDFLERHAH